MDLLDDLDSEPIKAKTFKKTIDIEVSDDQEEDFPIDTQVIEKSQAFTQYDDGKGEEDGYKADSETPATRSAPTVNLFGSGNALLSKIKRRLNGKREPEEENKPTQKTEQDESTQGSTQDIATVPESFEQAPTRGVALAQELSELTDTASMTPTESSDTQRVQSMDNSLSSTTQKIDSQTQVIPQVLDLPLPAVDEENDEVNTTTARPKRRQIFSDDDDDDGDRAPVNNSDDGEDIFGETQAVDNANVPSSPPAAADNTASNNNLFVSEDESEEETVPVPEKSEAEEREERRKRVEALAEKMRAERLLKMQQEKSKSSKYIGDDDSSKANEKKSKQKKSLEDDINGDADEDDDYHSDAEDEKNETFDLQSNVVKRFAKTDLLAAFGLSKAGTREMESLPDSDQIAPSTAQTSPVEPPKEKSVEKKHQSINLDSDSGEDDDTFDVLNMLKNTEPLKQEKQAQPTATTKLQPPLPLKAKPEAASKVIDLADSDSDEDLVIDIPVSKSKVLDIKARFSKTKMEKKKAKQKNTMITKNSIFSYLKSASKKQIHAEIKERQGGVPEPAKDDLEEVIDIESLLMKHIKHAERVQEQEEKSQSHKRSSSDSEDDGDYGEVPESDVPDSDYGDEEEQDDEAGEDEDAQNDLIPSSQMPKPAVSVEDDEAQIKKRSKRRNVLEDDEDEEDKESTHAPKVDIRQVLGKVDKENGNGNSIDLGFFGGNLSQSGLGQTQKLKDDLGVSMTQLFEKGSPRAKVYGDKAFSEIRENQLNVIGEDVSMDVSNGDDLKQDSFFKVPTQEPAQEIDYDEPSTQIADVVPPSANPSFSLGADIPSQTQSFTAATLKDSMTQKDSVTQADIVSGDTQNDDAADLDSDEEDEFAAPRHRRRLLKKGELSDAEDESAGEDEQEETEQERLERIRQAELFRQQRLQDFKMEKRRKKEMKAKGLDMIMENEAEESEDEWVGVGGADGEKEDQYDSEDEKMFDDITKIKQDRADLAKKIHDESAESDQKMLMKILKDLETGNWKKRTGAGGDDGLDYDDEEDELIRRYRLYKMNKKRQMLEDDANLRQLAKDKKSKAFFQSITEDSQLDSRNDIFGGVASGSDSESEQDENDDPFVDKAAKDLLKSPEDLSKKTKKKRTITQAYVQKSLSFLNDMEDEESQPQQMAYLDEDDSFEDLHALRQNSTIQVTTQTPLKKKAAVIDETPSSPSDMFKMPSLKRSFQMMEKTSIRNTDVTISTSARTVSGAGSSIMSLGKSKVTTKLDVKSQRVLKAQKVKKQVKSHGMLKNLVSSGSRGFE